MWGWLAWFDFKVEFLTNGGLQDAMNPLPVNDSVLMKQVEWTLLINDIVLLLPCMTFCMTIKHVCLSLPCIEFGKLTFALEIIGSRSVLSSVPVETRELTVPLAESKCTVTSFDTDWSQCPSLMTSCLCTCGWVLFSAWVFNKWRWTMT